jgi:FlaA1/EpsC-like NDP-sugar epimerase
LKFTLSEDYVQKYLIQFRWALVQLSHLALIAISLVLAFLLRFDFAIPEDQLPLLYEGLKIAIPLKLIFFHFAGLSRGWWRYIGIVDLMRLVTVNVAASLSLALAALLVVGRSFPRSIYCIDFLLCLFIVAGLRLGVRLYFERKVRTRSATGKRKRILVYGAGSSALALLREIQLDPSLNYEAVGMLDDDPNKRGMSILGVPVLGPGRDLGAIADRLHRKNRAVDEVVIAMPSASREQMRDALANCRTGRIASKTLPGIGEMLRGSGLVTQIREVSITDLLGREPVQIDRSRVEPSVAGRTILVTGATGSIGSELCRQLATFDPTRIVAFDQAESELFKIDREFQARFPDVEFVAVVGDIRSPATLDEVLSTYRVEAVFHAAAYKHVPLMEQYPLEAIRNNVLGTWNLAQAAYRNHVPTFVMISSDKAVKPSSIMGATKRLAELILSAMSTDRTKFVSVRFGNVLGSNGSVVPIFQQQIDAGGPVTITHPDMCRYFMTIPEAAQLVLVASTMGRGSEVFVLDMGDPIRIVDLARTMIRLAGKIPDEDIEIQFTGLRAGEKLYEEISSAEDVLPTSHKKVLIFQGQRAGRELIDRALPKIERLLEARDVDGMVAYLVELVPEFKPDPRRWGQIPTASEVMTARAGRLGA